MSDLSRPATPDEIAATKIAAIPGEVYAAFNEVIAANLVGSISEFAQDAAIDAILSRLPDITRQEVFRRRWLDVESAYEAAGWDVSYDKPSYNETYPASFKFKRRATR